MSMPNTPVAAVKHCIEPSKTRELMILLAQQIEVLQLQVKELAAAVAEAKAKPVEQKPEPVKPVEVVK